MNSIRILESCKLGSNSVHEDDVRFTWSVWLRSGHMWQWVRRAFIVNKKYSIRNSIAVPKFTTYS